MRFLIVVGICVFMGCNNLQTNTIDAKLIEKKNGLVYADDNLYTGYVLTLSDAKDTVEFYSVKNGKMDGAYIGYYPSGVINELRFFKNNRRHGYHQKWYPTGQKAFEYYYDNGFYIDTLKEWYPNGQLYLLSHYTNGQQSGRQKAWTENGELYLNYDVVNGRKYGNAGIKHCKSLWNEVVAGN